MEGAVYLPVPPTLVLRRGRKRVKESVWGVENSWQWTPRWHVQTTGPPSVCVLCAGWLLRERGSLVSQQPPTDESERFFCLFFCFCHDLQKHVEQNIWQGTPLTDTHFCLKEVSRLFIQSCGGYLSYFQRFSDVSEGLFNVIFSRHVPQPLVPGSLVEEHSLVMQRFKCGCCCYCCLFLRVLYTDFDVIVFASRPPYFPIPVKVGNSWGDPALRAEHHVVDECLLNTRSCATEIKNTVTFYWRLQYCAKSELTTSHFVSFPKYFNNSIFIW